MFESVFKTQFPADLGKVCLIALHADLRGSTQTKKYPESDSKKYPLVKKKFKEAAQSLREKARFVFSYRKEGGECEAYFRVGEQGDNLEIAFCSPWPDLAALSALHFSLCLNQAVLGEKLNSHGLAIGIGIHVSSIELGGDILSEAEPNAFTRPGRMSAYVKKQYPPPNYDTKIFVSKKLHDLLIPSWQQRFSSRGQHNIAKDGDPEEMKEEILEFKDAEFDSAMVELDSLFEAGNVGILPEGLCPGMTGNNKGKQGFFKYLIDTAHSDIKILQTYIPYIDDFKPHFKNAFDRRVKIEILYLNPYMSAEFATTFEEKMKTSPKVVQKHSPLAFQRGIDLHFSPPKEFYSEIIHYKTSLSNLIKGVPELDLQRPYDATPSACLNLFDNVLFVGNFLQGSYALATPHFVILGGSTVFNRFMDDFKTLWGSNGK
ncbi:MAG: hypothetical protein WBD64_08755 [Candidatus Zixiibacteriota bacterium]